MKKRILFLCTHNSARSQMAEGLFRRLAGDRYEVYSAGTEVTRVHPLAIEAMREVGIDLTGHRSKLIEEFKPEDLDLVITVCDNAREACPVLPGVEMLHWGFEDPSAASGDETARLAKFREVRDQIDSRMRAYMS
jgi:arsenate reductase (thioredoxin)